MLEESHIYDSEVAEIMKRLKAKGIVLIVIEGEKNDSPIEFASVLEPFMMDEVTEVLDIVSSSINQQTIAIRKKFLD